MKSEQDLVLGAVRNEKIASRQGILQRLFAVWFDAFVYNQIWEDPRVDLQALRLDEKSRVLTISSGGCNALNYLLENPASVTAVDLNRHHIYLLNLKIAALRFLPAHEDFFAFSVTAKAKKTSRIIKNSSRRSWTKRRARSGNRIPLSAKSRTPNASIFSAKAVFTNTRATAIFCAFFINSRAFWAASRKSF